jgi:hypothetical protein
MVKNIASHGAAVQIARILMALVAITALANTVKEIGFISFQST